VSSVNAAVSRPRRAVSANDGILAPIYAQISRRKTNSWHSTPTGNKPDPESHSWQPTCKHNKEQILQISGQKWVVSENLRSTDVIRDCAAYEQCLEKQTQRSMWRVVLDKVGMMSRSTNYRSFWRRSSHPSLDWCKTPSLLSQSLDWYWQNWTQLHQEQHKNCARKITAYAQAEANETKDWCRGFLCHHWRKHWAYCTASQARKKMTIIIEIIVIIITIPSLEVLLMLKLPLNHIYHNSKTNARISKKPTEVSLSVLADLAVHLALSSVLTLQLLPTFCAHRFSVDFDCNLTHTYINKNHHWSGGYKCWTNKNTTKQ